MEFATPVHSQLAFFTGYPSLTLGKNIFVKQSVKKPYGTTNLELISIR